MGIILAAFAGAFFSFLFVKLAEHFSNIHDTKKLHYYSLLKIQTILTYHLDEIPSNIDEINSVIKIDKGMKGYVNIITNKPMTIEFDQSVMLNLMNIDIIYELTLHICNLRRYNVIISDTNEAYNLFRNAFIQKTIDEDTYKRNFKTISSALEKIKDFLEKLNIDTKKILCMVRIRIREDKTNLFKSIFCKLPDTNEDDFEDKVEKELKELEKEKVKNKEKSKTGSK